MGDFTYNSKKIETEHVSIEQKDNGEVVMRNKKTGSEATVPGGGGGGVEVRSNDPAEPSAGDSWFNKTDEVLRVAYDDGGSVGVREVRSVFTDADVRVVEDFEGQTISNLEAIYDLNADQQIAQQNGSDRLEITAAPGETGGVYWLEQTDEVAAKGYIPDENSTVGVSFTNDYGERDVYITPILSGIVSEPTIYLYDNINGQPIDTVAVPQSNFVGGDIELSLRLDGNGNVIGEATDVNGDTTTVSGSAPAGLTRDGYGVQGEKFGGSGGSKIYIDDVKAFTEGQEVSPALSEYARIDAVPDAYINSGEGVVDNGSGLEVVENEVNHNSLSGYTPEQHHPVYVQLSAPQTEQIENAIWVDTSQSPPRIKRFDGEFWQNIGAEVTTHDNTAHSETYALASDIPDAVDDHANLTNVQTDQHHTRPIAGTGVTEDGSNNFNVDHDATQNYSADEHRPLLIDTISNRPAAGTEGRFFYATDEPALYHDDGTSWNHIAGRKVKGNITDDEGNTVYDYENHRLLGDYDVAGESITNNGSAVFDGAAGELNDSIIPIDSSLERVAGGLAVNESNVDHDSLQNYVGDEHRPLLIDTLSNRPTAGTADRFFYATDETVLYYDDGSSWSVVGKTATYDKIEAPSSDPYTVDADGVDKLICYPSDNQTIILPDTPNDGSINQRVTISAAGASGVTVQGAASGHLSFEGDLTADSLDIPEDGKVTFISSVRQSADGWEVLSKTFNPNSGVVTFSGDGSQTTFTITADYEAPPNAEAVVQAKTADAAGDKYISRVSGAGGPNGEAEIDVTFKSAPSSGTDNLVFHYRIGD